MYHRGGAHVPSPPPKLSATLLHAIVEHLPDMVFVKDADDLRFVLLNAAAERVLGYPRSDLLGRSDSDFFPPEEAAFFLEKDRAVLASGSLLDIPEEPVHTRDDSVRWLHTKKIPLYGRDGEAAFLLGISRDVTELRTARHALESSERQFRAVLEHFPGIVWTADHDGVVTWVAGTRANTLADAEHDRSVDAWLGATKDGARISDLQREAAEGASVTFELERGPYRFECRLVALDRGVIGIALDVTERLRLAQQRLEVQLQRTQRMEALGMLAGGIAHDFNNLLVGILGHLSLAKAHLDSDGPAAHHVARAEAAAERAADLTRQMLAYSGKGRFVVEPLDLSQLVQEIAELLRVSISKRATLALDLPEHLPLVEADASQMRQIAMNLLTNASDALGERQGTIRVTIRAVDLDGRADTSDLDLTEGRYVALEVADTGVGMDEATRRRMFDPFFTTKPHGHGLGLAAIQGIVRGHRGGIVVYSEPGHGTTIRVLLPTTERAPIARYVPEPAPTVGPATVLVVDDDPYVRDFACSALELAGFSVLPASDGDVAVEIFQRDPERVSVVLLDLTMPRMDGEATFRELRKLKANLPIILSSGHNQQDAITRFAGKGLADFLQKPYRASDLIARIRAHVRS
jgi:PAS domain S-box-containing protein